MPTLHWLQLYRQFGEYDRMNSDVKRDQEKPESDFSRAGNVSISIFSWGKLFPFSHDAEDDQHGGEYEEQYNHFEKNQRGRVRSLSADFFWIAEEF